MKKGIIFFLIASVYLLAGCSSPYVGAQSKYYKGDPAAAEEIIAPVSEKALKKNSNNKNLLLWDLGVYRFAQGNYDGAIQTFMQSVRAVEDIHGAGRTALSALTSAAGQEYVGDPVEISMAYLYIGLSYYMKRDYENALVGFRRSLEEDLSKDESRQGDMGITNYVMGECYFVTGRYNDAVVAFKRTVEKDENFVPGWVGLYQALTKLGDTAELPMVEKKLSEKVESGYMERVLENSQQGITVVMFAGHASKVEKDAFLGAFRKRHEIKIDNKPWKVNVFPEKKSYETFYADKMHDHFTDQGGLGDEARKQATRALISAGFEICLGGGGPSSDADVRYWPTMPGYIYVGYLPVDPGCYSLELESEGKKGQLVKKATGNWEKIVVEEGKRTMVVVTSFGTASATVTE